MPTAKKCLFILLFSLFTLGCSDSPKTKTQAEADHIHPEANPHYFELLTVTPISGADCSMGMAQTYPCENIDFVGGLKFNAQASDIWGWTDPVTNDEYALVGLASGTAFVRITNPETPTLVAFLPSETATSSWRDIKTIANHALVVSEAPKHGLQVFDLTHLRGLQRVIEFTPDAHYHQFRGAHNIAVNEDTGFAYVVGSNTCLGGLNMIDISNPLTPVFSGCYNNAGYTHDTQCVTYNGPDTDYLGHEICFSANEDSLSVTDVSNKERPINIFTQTYSGVQYSHQGWLSEDQRYFFLGDELDEVNFGHATRTYIWDLMDLDNPVQNYEYIGPTSASDHNMYVKEDHIYQANYRAGIRILRKGNLSLGELVQVGLFDTVPQSDSAGFSGTWSVFPYYNSGLIVTANISGELFVLRPRLAEITRCNDGIDNDGDGNTDFPDDPSCIDETGQSELDVR